MKIEALIPFKPKTISLLVSLSITGFALTPIYAQTTAEDKSIVKQTQDAFELNVLKIYADTHPSQSLKNEVNRGFDESRSSSVIDGSLFKNLNPVNLNDTVRHNAVGIINSPWGGHRFGGSKKIRAFGGWGSAVSIDGLPAIRGAEQEGGGYTGTLIPSIAVDTVEVRRGGQAIQFGDGTDSGTIVTRIKSGANYRNHQALSLDYSTVNEIQLQAEAAHGWDTGDFYIAGRWLEGSYDGTPPNLDKQSIKGLVGKGGWNISNSTRVESLLIYDNSKPDIIRRGEINKIETRSLVASVTLDHSFSDNTSLQVGYLHTDTNIKWPARNRDRSTNNDLAFANGYFTTNLTPSIKYLGSAGLEYRMVDTLRDKKWFNQFDDISIRNANTFIFDDNLALSFGLRNTWFDNTIEYENVVQPDNLRTDTLLSYELGAAYSVTNALRLRTSIASGYNRFSSKYGNFGTDALHPDGAGDEVLEALTLEVGANYDWGNGYVDIAVYDLQQDGVPRRNAGKIESMQVNQQGLEIELFSELTEKLSLSSGFTHIMDVEAIRADGTKVNSNIFWGRQVAPVPENQFSLRMNYNLDDAWSLWGAGFYSSGFSRTNAAGDTTETQSYERIDIGTSWQFNKDALLKLRVENITDQKDFGRTLKGKKIDDKDKIGQVVWLGVDYQF